MTRVLVVVDMQNGFCHSGGSLAQLGMTLAGVDRAVTQTAKAVANARECGVPVVFTRHVYRPGRADEGRNLSRLSPRLAEIGGLLAGSWDGDVVEELGCAADDLVIDKVRFDAFLWTSLDPLLQGLAATELFLTGVVTNICVESTARSAFMRDYPVTILGDCCAAQTSRLHEISLEALAAYGLASVTSVEAGFRFEPQVVAESAA